MNFEITIEQIWELFLKQNRKCALSGELLYFYPEDKRNTSLDRKDSDIGYKIDNIQWVHKDLNIMKMDCPNEKFINWCKKVADYNLIR